MHTRRCLNRLHCRNAARYCSERAPTVTNFGRRCCDQFVPTKLTVAYKPTLIFTEGVPCYIHVRGVPRLAGLSIIQPELVTNGATRVTQTCTWIEYQELLVSREEPNDRTVYVQCVVVREAHTREVRDSGKDRIVCRSVACDDVDVRDRKHQHANCGRHEAHNARGQYIKVERTGSIAVSGRSVRT